MQFSPRVTFDPKVHAYLEHAFGASRLQQMSAALAKPSLHTCLSVNTLRTCPQDVVQRLQQLFPGSSPYCHPAVDAAVILPGRGPLPLDMGAAGGREVVVNRLAGEAVLQGAHVYAPGLLAATSGLAEGDLVAVTVAVEPHPGYGSRKLDGPSCSSCMPVAAADRGWTGLNRGMRLTQELQARLPSRQDLCVGLGRVTAGRRELFQRQQGLAVEMVQRVFDVMPCNGVLPGEVLLQSLPCVVAAQALDPQPGSRVLDMCAAPGVKTSIIAQTIAGHAGSSVLALDRTAAKAARVRQLADSWGAGHVVQVMAADSTQLYQQQQQQQQKQGVCLQQQPPDFDDGDLRQPATSSHATKSKQHARSRERGRQRTKDHQQQQQQQPDLLAAAQPESFDAVLLDAPCSALGLRPRLAMGWQLPQLEALAAYQRALLHAAVHVLKPGGSLVYCTCTINPGENEANVRYVLDKWPSMKLVQQPVVLGGPGLTGPGLLSTAEAQLVQRFDPADGAPDDTIGFFIAKFVKQNIA